MSKPGLEKTNSDRMVKKNRENVPQPERAGTGPESQTYQQRTGRYVENDQANRAVETPDKPADPDSPKKG